MHVCEHAEWAKENSGQDSQTCLQDAFQTVRVADIRKQQLTSLMHRYAKKLLESVAELLSSSLTPEPSSCSPDSPCPPLAPEPPPGPPAQPSAPRPQVAKPLWSEGELDELNSLVEEEWRKVVLYFVLRLALAPCVETMILLDRKLFLLEQGKGSTLLQNFYLLIALPQVIKMFLCYEFLIQNYRLETQCCWLDKFAETCQKKLFL